MEGEIAVVAVVIFEDCVHEQLYFVVVVVVAASRSPGCSLDLVICAVVGIVARLLAVIALDLGVVDAYDGK